MKDTQDFTINQLSFALSSANDGLPNPDFERVFLYGNRCKEKPATVTLMSNCSGLTLDEFFLLDHNFYRLFTIPGLILQHIHSAG